MINRRQFVQTVAVGIGASHVSLSGATSSPFRFFTEAEANLAEAISEQVLPGDEDPGARQAGVVNFLDRQLAGKYRAHQDSYREGLAGVDATSQAMFGRRFLELNGASRLVVLKDLEAGKAQGAPWEKISSRAFFQLIRDHTMQGYYGSPRHGGNRGYASYHMLGLDYPQVIGQNRYRPR